MILKRCLRKQSDDEFKLNALVRKYVNLEYTLSNGQKVKFLDDQKTYLGKSGDGRTAWDYTKTGNGFCDDNDGVYTGDRNPYCIRNRQGYERKYVS